MSPAESTVEVLREAEEARRSSVWRVPNLLKVRPAESESRRGELFWRCIACPESGGYESTVGAANNTAREHALLECRTVAAAADRLIADVLALPGYRVVWLIAGAPPAFACTDCGRMVYDRDAHTAEHIEASEAVSRG